MLLLEIRVHCIHLRKHCLSICYPFENISFKYSLFIIVVFYQKCGISFPLKLEKYQIEKGIRMSEKCRFLFSLCEIPLSSNCISSSLHRSNTQMVGVGNSIEGRNQRIPDYFQRNLQETKKNE